MKIDRKRFFSAIPVWAWMLLFVVLLAVSLVEHDAPRKPDVSPKPDDPAKTGAPASVLAVRVLDVGQGDSIFVRFPGGGTMLVDAGGSNAGPKVVESLRSLGVRKIDILVATHPHEDHIGGMLHVLDAFPVGKIWDSGYIHGSRTQQRFLEAVKERGIRFGRPKGGFSEKNGGVLIEVLAPVSEITGTSSDANNNSLVLRLSLGAVSFLLTADMEKEQRRSVGRFPESTVLKVSHHGSRNGTDARFLNMVRPKVAIISCAARNPYGHPHTEVLLFLEKAEAELFTTIGGDVVVETDGETFTARKETGEKKAVGKQAPLYVGNRSSRVFHLSKPDEEHPQGESVVCGGLPAERNRVFFQSAGDAIKAGYRPCGRCFQ